MKELLKSAIGLIVAFAFSGLIAKFPDFPLTATNLISLVLWAVGFAVGGWQTRNLVIRKMTFPKQYKTRY